MNSPARPSDDVCVKNGKTRHPTYDEAQRKLASLRQLVRGYVGEVYRCRFCGSWHVGQSFDTRKPMQEKKFQITTRRVRFRAKKKRRRRP